MAFVYVLASPLLPDSRVLVVVRGQMAPNVRETWSNRRTLAGATQGSNANEKEVGREKAGCLS